MAQKIPLNIISMTSTHYNVYVLLPSYKTAMYLPGCNADKTVTAMYLPGCNADKTVSILPKFISKNVSSKEIIRLRHWDKTMM